MIALSNKKISQRTLISKSEVKFLCRTEPMSRNRIPENAADMEDLRQRLDELIDIGKQILSKLAEL